MTPRRILVCLDSLAAGGAERQTVELVKRLDRTRFEVRVVTLHGPRAHQSCHFVPELKAAGIEVDELDRRWSLPELPGSVAGLGRCILRFRPHLIHSVSHHCNHLTRLLRVALGFRFRLLTAIRTEYNARQLRNERWEQPLSSMVVCNSPSMLAKLRDHSRIPTSRLRYIPNGIDIGRFASNPDPELRSRLAPRARRIAVMLARITEQKAPDLLARAVGRLAESGRLPADCEIWIVGERENEGVQRRLDEAIRQYRLEARVRLFPATQQPAAFLHAADLTVLASLWEGTPNSVLESLAAGKAALVSEAANASGLIVPDLHGWTVPTGEVESLAEGVFRTLQLSDDTLRGMAAPCRQRAAEFDLPTMVGRYEALYAELLGETQAA